IAHGAGGWVHRPRLVEREWRVAVLVGIHAVGGRRRNENRFFSRPPAEMAQRRVVVEHPDGAAFGGGDQVAAVNGQVVDAGGRQVELQRLPGAAVVEGDDEGGEGAV